MSLSAPVRSFEADPRAWHTVTDQLPGSETGRLVHGGKVRAGDADVFVGAAVIRATGQVVGKIEFNPSRVVDGEGVGLATVSEARESAAAAWAAASELVEWSGDLDGAKIKRLDVARDFGEVEQPGTLIRALAPVHRAWARRNLVHADPARNGAQTLMVGSGAGVARLYDKCAETKGRAAPGTVRFEAESRSGWVSNYGGMTTVSDLNEQRVRRLAANRWDWSAMGVEVGGTGRVVDKVRRSGLSEREQASFLGWLMMQSAGQAWEGASRTTLAKYRRVQRDLGIAVDELDQGGGFVTRLDFETGREVSRVA